MRNDRDDGREIIRSDSPEMEIRHRVVGIPSSTVRISSTVSASTSPSSRTRDVSRSSGRATKTGAPHRALLCRHHDRLGHDRRWTRRPVRAPKPTSTRDSSRNRKRSNHFRAGTSGTPPRAHRCHHPQQPDRGRSEPEHASGRGACAPDGRCPSQPRRRHRDPRNRGRGRRSSLCRVALIIGVDRLLDMSRTAVNVTGDITACLVLERWLGDEQGPASMASKTHAPQP